FLFFTDTCPTEIYTLSLHDALPILGCQPLRLEPQSAETSASHHSRWFALGAPNLERAVTRARLIDPPCGAPRNERRHVHDRVNAALIADEVDIPAVINEPRPRLDDVRRAVGIVSSVERQGAALDDHEARPRVRVPAKGPARRDPVLQDVEIGFTLGVDPGLPAARERLRVDLVELPH